MSAINLESCAGQQIGLLQELSTRDLRGVTGSFKHNSADLFLKYLAHWQAL